MGAGVTVRLQSTSYALIFPSHDSVRRAGFSLAELVVSIGILVLMLSLVGQVFHLTVKSTGQATALTEVTQSIRAFEQALRDDLSGVHRGRSALLIQGNTKAAYLTNDAQSAAGAEEPPTVRTDLLLFYTSRKGNSYIQPDVTSNVQQVVYGHADLGEWIPQSGGAVNSYEFSPMSGTTGISMYGDPGSVAPTPASKWHLGRRSTLMLPTPTPAWGVNMQTGSPDDLGFLLTGERDILGEVDYEGLVLRPFGEAPHFVPQILGSLGAPGTGIMMHERSMLDATPPSMLLNAQQKFYGMGHHMLPACASFKVEWALDPRSSFVKGRLDGLGEMLWFDPGDAGNDSRSPAGPADPDPLWSLEEKIYSLKDSTNSAEQRLRAQLISLRDTPVCETDPLNSRISECDPGSESGRVYSLADRFRGADYPGLTNGWAPLGGLKTLAFFGATRPRWKLYPPVSGESLPDLNDTIPDPMFPGALRITVEVFDDQQRLEKPVRHVMVIPLGE